MPRFDQDNLARARSLVALYPHKRSALVPLLHLVQEQDGYVSDDGIEHVAELLDLTPAEVRGTASFYDMFHLEPIGRYLVAICTNIACMLDGAYQLLDHISDTLGVRPGGTTEDGMFTLEDAECLALCGNAPCLTVNWRYFGDMTPEKWGSLADDLRSGALAGEVPPHGTLCRVQRSVGLMAPGVAPGAAPGATTPGATTPAPGDGNRTATVDLSNSRTTPALASTVLVAGTDRAGTDRAGTDRAGTDRAGTDRAGTGQAAGATAGRDAGRPAAPGRPAPAAAGQGNGAGEPGEGGPRGRGRRR